MAWQALASQNVIACQVCGAANSFAPLTEPWRGTSLISDLRTTTARLDRAACAECGLVRRWHLPTADDQRAIFDESYTLFAAPPSAHAQRRQQAIAAWIRGALGELTPKSVFEIGSGDGSLLEALQTLLPKARACGIEPAAQSVAEARRRGLNVSQGFSDAANDRNELVISVNVIEHALDPIAFLSSVRAAMMDDGRAVIVCPDGDIPSYELMFYDHLYSFGASALKALAARVGLTAIDIIKAPIEIGPFHLLLARKSEVLAPLNVNDRAIVAAKDAYLASWARLDDVLLERIADRAPLALFGNGDVAALLRVYAPRVFARITTCLIDGAPTSASFENLPTQSLATYSAGGAIALGTRPGSHAALTTRLSALGHHVIRWDDLIAQ